MEGIKQICTKELARVFKDRKMLISVFVFPVAIMIVVMSLVSNLTSRMEKDVEAHKSIVYIENVPEEFKEFLLAADKDVSIYTEKNIGEVLRLETKGALDESQRRKEAETAIKEGSIDLMIEFPQGFSENVYDYQTGDEIHR